MSEVALLFGRRRNLILFRLHQFQEMSRYLDMTFNEFHRF